MEDILSRDNLNDISTHFGGNSVISMDLHQSATMGVLDEAIQMVGKEASVDEEMPINDGDSSERDSSSNGSISFKGLDVSGLSETAVKKNFLGKDREDKESNTFSDANNDDEDRSSHFERQLWNLKEEHEALGDEAMSLSAELQQARKDAELLTSSLASAVPRAALAAIAHYSPTASPKSPEVNSRVRTIGSAFSAVEISTESSQMETDELLKTRIYELEQELSDLDAARARDALAAATEADMLVKRLQNAEETSKFAEERVQKEKTELLNALSLAQRKIEELEGKHADSAALRETLAIRDSNFQEELLRIRNAHAQVHAELASVKEKLSAQLEENHALRQELQDLQAVESEIGLDARLEASDLLLEEDCGSFSPVFEVNESVPLDSFGMIESDNPKDLVLSSTEEFAALRTANSIMETAKIKEMDKRHCEIDGSTDATIHAIHSSVHGADTIEQNIFGDVQDNHNKKGCSSTAKHFKRPLMVLEIKTSNQIQKPRLSTLPQKKALGGRRSLSRQVIVFGTTLLSVLGLALMNRKRNSTKRSLAT